MGWLEISSVARKIITAGLFESLCVECAVQRGALDSTLNTKTFEKSCGNDFSCYTTDFEPTHTSCASSHPHPKARISREHHPLLSNINRGQPVATLSMVS